MVNVSLDDSIARALMAKAAAQGLSMQAYLQAIANSDQDQPAAPISPEDFDRFLDEEATHGPSPQADLTEVDVAPLFLKATHRMRTVRTVVSPVFSGIARMSDEASRCRMKPAAFTGKLKDGAGNPCFTAGVFVLVGRRPPKAVLSHPGLRKMPPCGV